ncbi:hypothetical protein BDW62DRAFT_205422 [Aspergillus aurantiobrunneus]
MLLFAPAILLSLSSVTSAYCGALDPSDEGIALLTDLFNGNTAPQDFQNAENHNQQIEVYTHVIRQSEADSTLESSIPEQINVLNEVFQATEYTFTLAGSDAPVYNNLGTISIGTDAEAEIKQLRKGGAQALNLYIVPTIGEEDEGIAGYATFPWDYALDSQNDGIVVGRDYVPGGTSEGHNTGKVAGHEAGHWLGLLHTFQGGCLLFGDFISDTPAEASAARGCPVGRDSCLLGGEDPIHNHMDYSDDPCRTEFTPEQIERMSTVFGMFRSG